MQDLEEPNLPGPSDPSNQEVEGEMSITDCFKALLTIQKNTAVQFQAAQLQAERAQAQADEQHGPQFKGPFQEVEPFLTWMQGVTIFYSTRNVTHPDDKQLILGALITETNLLSYYSNVSAAFNGKSWEEFRTCLFKFCLPEDWRTELRQTIKHLEMSSTESFMEFSGRTRTLQSLVNFEKASISDFDLAEFVMFGLPHVFKTKVKDFQLLSVANFSYSNFESRTNGFYTSLSGFGLVPESGEAQGF
ncbi:hypothetical protein PTTG_06822 [Puccinia triticina 1-1 BBBD Race 1]|uniref:Retrotransposon gag domain-containing protein n=1 Tax=Puccinia triticina (isolate 1-1 / race 1 (BBBD)) TaxID=630390 RepID=A0A0C4F152_PUCT1|nr:hypothetical protein PTTG_06822 [Puccinia triticina 1-1 BBBD Race 1]